MILIPTFDERRNYLQLYGTVGEDTFGFDRIFNQMFYKSTEWRNIRNHVIARDMGYDLAHPDRAILGTILIHHMNPISIDDIKDGTDFLLNPEYLICTSLNTHNFIHYGIKSKTPPIVIERKPGDTCPWKQ